MKFDEHGNRIRSIQSPTDNVRYSKNKVSLEQNVRFITKGKKRIAIVGASERKVRPSKIDSYNRIESILKRNGCDANNCVIVSGHSPAGGIDIWAENIARQKNIPTDIYPAKVNNISGFYARNKQIANNSDILYNIVVKSPNSYCNHLKTYGHIQSGGCMTQKEAQKKGVKTNLELVERGV